MITVPVGEFKAHFSDFLKSVEQGEEVVISYGKRKRKVAALIPYDRLKRRKGTRSIGILKGKARFKLSRDFVIGDEELLRS